MMKSLRVTPALLGINVLVFLLLQSSPDGQGGIWGAWALHFPRHPLFGPWQFLSSIFVHADLSHLFMNMFGLYSFGAILERVWGPRRFLIFYLAAGLGAGGIHTGVNVLEYRAATSELRAAGLPDSLLRQLEAGEDPEQWLFEAETISPGFIQSGRVDSAVRMVTRFNSRTVGASGAIYGILTAFGLLFPRAKLSLIFLPIPIEARFFIPGLLLLDLFSGFTGFSLFGGGIAHFAHVGGAVIGFALMRLWRRDFALPPGMWVG